MNNNIGKITRVGIYWSIGLKLLQQFYNFIVFILVARIIGPSNFGVFAIAMSLIVYANNLTSFGLIGAIVQKTNITRKHIDCIFSINIIFSLALIPLFIWLSPEFSIFFNSPDLVNILPILTIIFPVTSFYYILMALLRRRLDFKTHSIFDLAQLTLQSTAILIFVIMGYGLWALVYGQIIGFVTVTIAITIKLRFIPSIRFDIKAFKEVFDYGFWDLFRGQINYLETYSSLLIISRFMDPSMVGIFERANSFSFAIIKRMQIQINAVLFSSFSQVKHSREILFNGFIKSILSLSLAITPILTGLCILSRHVVLTFLGIEWELMIFPLRILSLSCILMSYSSLFADLNIASDNYKMQSSVNAIAVFLMICFQLVGVSWGVKGISISILCSSLIFFYLYAHTVCKSINIKFFKIFLCIFPAMFSSFIMGISLLILSKYVFFECNFFNLCLLTFSGVIIYILCILFLPYKNVRKIIFEILQDFFPFIKKYQII